MSEIDKKQQIAESIRANQLLEDADKVRKAGLYNQTVGGQDILSASPSDLDSGIYKAQFEGAAGKNKHFSEKIFMFPESYNELRKELSTHWPTLWQQVQWRMANRAEEFVEIMNEALDVAVIFDTAAVDYISKTYLKRLQDMRGVK